MKYLKVLFSSIGAGLLIGLGGWVFISMFATSKFIGSLLFSLGLFTIIISKMHLYTGKIGYVFENKLSYVFELIIIWFGNFIGAAIIGLSLQATRNIDSVSLVLNNIVEAKLNDNIWSILLLSIFCGMMIYIAVAAQKKDIHPIFKLFAIIVPVIVFIISGFEHVVANMFYFIANGSFDIKVLGYLIIMTIGNSLGSWILWGIEKIMNIPEKTN